MRAQFNEADERDQKMQRTVSCSGLRRHDRGQPRPARERSLQRCDHLVHNVSTCCSCTSSMCDSHSTSVFSSLSATFRDVNTRKELPSTRLQKLTYWRQTLPSTRFLVMHHISKIFTQESQHKAKDPYPIEHHVASILFRRLRNASDNKNILNQDKSANIVSENAP